MKQTIHKDMTFQTILSLHPDTGNVLSHHKLECAGCLGAANETLEQGARVHGVSLELLLQELNALF